MERTKILNENNKIEDIIALIEQLLKEHQQFLKSISTVEQITNDLGVAFQLEEVKTSMMPGRLGQKRQDLPELGEMVAVLKSKLEGHFCREEVGLVNALKQHGNLMLISALNTLLLEHPPLRDRLYNLQREIIELEVEGLSREVWEGKVWGLRAYIMHTRRVLEEHSHSEYSLLKRAKKEIAGK